MNTSMDTLMIEINSTSKDATKSIDRLVQSLNTLQKSLSNVVKESSKFSELKTTLSSVKSPSITTENKTKKNKTPFSEYGSQESQIKALDLDFDADKPISSIKTLNSELTKYRTKSGDIVTVNKKVKDGLEGVKVSVKRVSDETRKGSSVWSVFTKGLSGTVAKFSIFAAAGRQALNSLGNLVDKAASYEESLNLFTVTLGEYAEQADKWVNMFSDALYLDPKNVMQYMGSFNSLIKGLGTGSEKAYIMSKNLTQLTFDLASFKNLKFEEAFQKLQSGISGEIEPLRNVGVALSQATLQELAYSMGIKTSVADMNEAQKSQLRYIQIMKSSVEWQTDMGRTLISPANALRVVRQQFSLLGQAIGRIFIPMVMAVIPYIMVLTKWLTSLANKIAKFLGYKIADIDYSGISAGFSDIGGGISDIGDAADKATDKLNTMLAPFDDLNVVQNQTKNAASGIGGIGGAGDLGVDLPEYDALANLTDKLSKNMKKAEENLKKFLPLIGALAGAFALLKIGKSVFKFFDLFSGASSIRGIKNVSSALGIGSSSLVGIMASLALYAVATAKEVPKLSKAFDDLAYNGKSLSEVSSSFSSIDVALLSLLGTDNIGKITLAITGLTKGIGYFTRESVKSKDVLDVYGDSLSKVSKKKLTPLVNEFENLNNSVTNLDLSNKIVTDKDITKIQSSLSTITSSITKELDADKNTQLKNLRTLEKSLGLEDTNALIEKTKSYYNGQKSIITTNSNKITEILTNASNDNRALTQEETSEINRLRSEMYDTTIKGVTDNSNEYYSIMSKLKTNLGTLSTEQASEYIQNAAKTRDESIKAAQEQYDSITAEAYKMYDTGQITKEEYEKIVDAAEKTKQESVKKAKDQYQEIYDTTSKKMGDTSKVIDEKTGKIKSNWKIFTEDLSSKWSGFTKGFKEGFTTKMNEVLEKAKTFLNKLKNKFESFKASIPTPHMSWSENGHRATGTIKKVLETLNLPTSMPKLNIQWYEQGGYPTSGDLFFANENGVPEMVGRIGNQTAVANNDQITTSITNALLSALSQYDFGGSKSPTTIYIGNKKVYEGYGDYVSEENDRYGTNMIRI